MRLRLGIASAAIIGVAGVLALAALSAQGQNPAVPQTAAAPQTPPPGAQVAFAHDGDRMTASVQTSLVQTICIQCHTDNRKPGGVSFENLTIDAIARDGELAER